MVIIPPALDKQRLEQNFSTILVSWSPRIPSPSPMWDSRLRQVCCKSDRLLAPVIYKEHIYHVK